MKQAGIYVNDVFCGILTEDEEGFHFSYDEAYMTSEEAIPVSPTMPLTKEPYDKEMMFPVFDGLIPEGWLLEKELIWQSFIPEEMKSNYCSLLEKRENALTTDYT